MIIDDIILIVYHLLVLFLELTVHHLIEPVQDGLASVQKLAAAGHVEVVHAGLLGEQGEDLQGNFVGSLQADPECVLEEGVELGVDLSEFGLEAVPSLVLQELLNEDDQAF